MCYFQFSLEEIYNAVGRTSKGNMQQGNRSPFNVSHPSFRNFFLLSFFPREGHRVTRCGECALTVWVGVRLRSVSWDHRLGHRCQVRYLKVSWITSLVYWGAVGLTPSGVRGRGPGGLGWDARRVPRFLKPHLELLRPWRVQIIGTWPRASEWASEWSSDQTWK